MQVWLIVTEQVAETEKAVKLVTDEDYGAAWLPKSQIELHDSPWGRICRMPYWLYRRNWHGVKYGTDDQVVPMLAARGQDKASLMAVCDQANRDYAAHLSEVTELWRQ